MNSSLQKLINLKKHSKNCIHTKNIYSLLDLPKKDDNYKRLSKHLENCKICSDEFQSFEVKTVAAIELIPKVIMDKDSRQSFEREVGELFKVMDLNERLLLKKKVKSGILFVDRMGIDFIQNLFSKTMLKTYLLAGAVFISLKYFL